MSYHLTRDFISTMETFNGSTLVKQRVENRNSLSVLTFNKAANLEGYCPIRVQNARRRSVNYVRTPHTNGYPSKDDEPALEDQCSAKKAAYLGEIKDEAVDYGYSPFEAETHLIHDRDNMRDPHKVNIGVTKIFRDNLNEVTSELNNLTASLWNIPEGSVEKAFVKRCIRNTSSYNTKLTTIHNMTIIIIMILLIPLCVSRPLGSPLDGPTLFDKHQKMDKLILKNQIGYHFKRVVREVSQELFVSRRIDVSALFSGIDALKQSAQDITHYCRTLGDGVVSTKGNIQELADYVYIKYPETASFAEVKARCEARKMQLPEVYTDLQHAHLGSFLRANKQKRCFAGLVPDYADAVFRFVSTGFPLWRTPHTKVYDVKGGYVSLDLAIDDFHTKLMYEEDGRLYARKIVPSIIEDSNFKLGDHTYRNNHKEFPQPVGPVICQTKWDGLTYDHFKADNRVVHGLKVSSYTKRDVKAEDTNALSASATLREFCASIASQTSDLHQTMSLKLKDLLALVDISVTKERDSNSRDQRNTDTTVMPVPLNMTISVKHRQKRIAFLSSFIFKTGIKVIWGLFGFLEKMRLERKLNKMEKSISETQRLSQDNYEAIQNMSSIVASNSIAIDHLRVTSNALAKRLDILEIKVTNLTLTVAGIANNLEDMMKLSYVANLILRIEQSMDTGYDTLKDVIHCSLLGQTSPLLLPTDQLALVQNEVRKVSTGILDTDFARMQSIVVADPNDPHLLLVVINIAALSRKEEELVKLIPIPQFEGDRAYLPELDYDTIILDQLAQKYSILNTQEEYDCLFHRCYVSDVERSIDQKTCGIPQLFDQQMDSCILEETISTGVFVKPMLPDGILFAFKAEVSTQLFCKDNSEIGTIRKLSGSGIMQLPNGCILSITDRYGKNTQVKGQPLYRMIDADDMTLIMNGPLKSVSSYQNVNGTQKRITPDVLINTHLNPVVQQVNTVDSKVDNNSHFIYGMFGVVSLTVIIILVIILVLFKSSKRFFLKIYDLRDRFAELARFIHTLHDFKERLSKRLLPPDFTQVKQRARAAVFRSPLRAKRALNNLRDSVHHLQSGNHRSEGELASEAHVSCDDAPTYISMCDVSALEPPTNLSENETYKSFKRQNTGSRIPRVPYPDLNSPFGPHNDELDDESAEVEALCKKFPKTSDDTDC